MRTLTERGFRWLVGSLGLFLAADAFLLASALLLPSGLVVGYEFSVLGFGGYLAFLVGSALAAFVGFRALRQGRHEFGAGHAARVRKATGAFAVGAASATLFFLTGLVLGYAYVPSSAYASTSMVSSPWPVLVGDAIRGVHAVAAPLLVVFLGLFLLLAVWDLSTRVLRILAIAAFACGTVAPVLAAVSLVVRLPSLAAGAGLALLVLPEVSLALWLVVCLRLVPHLRGAAARPAADPVPA